MNNSRPPRSGGDRGRGQNSTYNSNERGRPYNGQGQKMGGTMQSGSPQKHIGGHRSAMPRTAPTSKTQMKQPISFAPLFVSLLVLMISVGIFCTVLNSRAGRANADASDETDKNIAEQTDAVEGDNDKGTAPKVIEVSYASITDKTAELGDSIKSDYAIMIDLQSNTVVAQKNPDEIIYPASMTKIMTLIVAYENCKDLDDTFIMTAQITDPLYKANATVAGFSVGEEITIRDLLYGVVLPSGADATEALAIYTAGSTEGFVEMMNKKTLEMGLSNTHFVNTSGLHHDDHYSTPHEIALILQYAMQIEECREILSTYQYTTRSTPSHPNGILLTSTMFSRMKGDESGVAEIIGGKTGYTNEGLHCLASFGRVNGGGEFVLVTAHAPATYDPVYDCINTYKNLFSE